jgi:exonuclease SbcD
MTVGTAPTMLKSSLSPDAFDYIALGHHHNNMDLSENTPCWYAGSMQPVDFGEEGQRKGFMVLEIDPAKRHGARVSGSGLPRLVPVPARRFVTIEVKPKDLDPTTEVCAAIERAAVKDAIVRVRVECSRDQGNAFRIPAARALLQEAHFVQRVEVAYPDASRRPVLPAGVTLDAKSPIEVLDVYFRAQQVEQAKHERLRQAAIDLYQTVVN